MAKALHPDSNGKLYHVTSDGVTIKLTNKWETAFTAFQETGKRVGFARCKLVTLTDKRDLSAQVYQEAA